MKFSVLKLFVYGSVICFLVYVNATLADNFYEILGVAKHASDKEIRKAFKKKALELHPDKNKDDVNAQANFIKLNKAYEVLKDEELRKKYDLYGEEGLDKSGSRGSKYHSWNYYQDNFGIYDDDPEIITLNRADFDQSVIGSDDVWFINFYHPMCSHCHTLAPIWRRVAQELDGVVRVGAVNCDDSYHLCASQGTRSYPSLISYPTKELFHGEKSKEDLIKFILEKLHTNPLYKLNKSNWRSEAKTCNKMPWLVVKEPEFEDFEVVKIKLSAIFAGLLCLAEVDCSSSEEPCASLGLRNNAKFFHNVDDLYAGKGHHIENMNPQELARQVLELLPDIPLLSPIAYKDVQQKLATREEAAPWLIVYAAENDEKNLEMRKLPALLPSFNIGKVMCEELKKDCDDLYILKTPTFLLFKPGGGYEIHQGRIRAHDIAVFAREGAQTTQFQILTPNEFPRVLKDGLPWFIDFYAPWCPPCMKLLPEFRKASRVLDMPVRFGSIDCTVHSSLCSQFNIRQYPTTILYNETVPHQYMGHHSASHLIDFVRDTIQPTVITLNEETYNEKIVKKKASELWIVDFYANWCSHCIEMAPEYRRFGRLISGLSDVFVAQIDCAVYRQVCQREEIKGYPSVRLFQKGYYGNKHSVQYNGWSRDAESFRQWLYSMLPSKVKPLDDRTFEEMLRSKDPWLVDFYAPWCVHCQAFAPEFEDIASELDGYVNCGKVNCETHHWLCRGAGVRAYPTIMMYEGASENSLRQDARGGRDVETLEKSGILKLVKQFIRTTARHELGDQRLRDEL